MNAAQLLQHFEALAEVPEAVGKLRQLILDLAANGRFTSGQDTVLSQKQQLGYVIELISGQHLGPEEYNQSGDGLPYFTGPSDFGVKFPVVSRWTTKPKVTARKGDILLTVKGAGVGKTNIVSHDEVAIGRQLMAVRPRNGTDRGFIELSLQAAFALFQAASNGIAIPGISRQDVLKHEIWLPDFAEQTRIVAQVEKLLVLCDELEARQKAARELGAKTLDALIHRVLDPFFRGNEGRTTADYRGG